MFSLLLSVFSTLILGLLSLVHAAPVTPVEFLAVAPTIIYPTSDTVWTTGSYQSVTWKTDNVPEEARNYTVTILLGYFANDSENLDIKRPLAAQIPIMQGTATITVPSDAVYRNNYTVALIGDSGNVSPPFTITH